VVSAAQRRPSAASAAWFGRGSIAAISAGQCRDYHYSPGYSCIHLATVQVSRVRRTTNECSTAASRSSIPRQSTRSSTARGAVDGFVCTEGDAALPLSEPVAGGLAGMRSAYPLFSQVRCVALPHRRGLPAGDPDDVLLPASRSPASCDRRCVGKRAESDPVSRLLAAPPDHHPQAGADHHACPATGRSERRNSEASCGCLARILI